MNDTELDRLIAELPQLEPPTELDAGILSMIADAPQDLGPLDVVDDGPADPLLPIAEDLPEPANRPGRWMLLVGPLVAIAAAALVAIMVVPIGGGAGNPADWTYRGDPGAGPGLDLSMAVRDGSGTERFVRGQSYAPGDTLLFRVDAYAGGVVTLVRVDANGAEVIHTQAFDQAGTADLEMEGGRLGYALEMGEAEAVFAAIRTEAPLSEADIRKGLAVGADVEAVCAAAWELGGRCAAERVEAVQ